MAAYQTYVPAQFILSMCLPPSTDKGPTVCQKVFELGLRNHASQPGYAKAYLEFLTSLGDSTNIRALYERALASIPGADPAPLHACRADF